MRELRQAYTSIGRSIARSERIIRRDEGGFGYAEICAELGARFGTSFEVEVTGSCVTMVASLEGGIQVVVTDCEAPLSPVERHLTGRAAGFFVRLRREQLDTEGGADVDVELAYACNELAAPTAEAIGTWCERLWSTPQIGFEEARPGGQRWVMLGQ